MAEPTPRRPVMTAGDMLRSPTTTDGPSKTAGFADIGGLDEVNEALEGRGLTVGAVLTSADPEPGHWVTVETPLGDRWRRTDGNYNGGGAANWEQEDAAGFEPESWTRVCEYGPVTVVEIDG